MRIVLAEGSVLKLGFVFQTCVVHDYPEDVDLKTDPNHTENGQGHKMS